MLMKPVTVFALVLSLACAGDSNTPLDDLSVTCTGKCDGLDSIKSLYRDIRDLDLTDLGARGTNLATDALNDALSTSFVDVDLDEPQAFGLADTAASNELVEDLDALTIGLLERFGEGELSTEVNEVRRAHLAGSGDEVFVESGFTVRASLEHGFNIDADGIESSTVRLGLGGGAISGRVIAAAERGPGTNAEAVLEGVQSARGFVAPRDISELRSMKPGEAFALSGEGTFGLNLGAGVPIVIANAGPATYSLVVSGALRAQIAGQLDVQMVRLNGDEVVVDVGTERSSIRSARLAVNDGWGVSGLVESEVTLAGQNIDLGRVLDRALRSRLNDRLDLVSAEFERTGSSSRMSVTRIRFNLDSGDAMLEDAVSQALRGDVRLAQAMAQQGAGGVKVEYDLSRSGLSSVSHAGLDLFGMRFFNRTVTSEGAVRIATPGGAQELLFDSLHRESGWLFETHGHGRIALSGLRFDIDGQPTESEVNLFVQVLEGDDFMQRDTLLDHLDSLIYAVGGSRALDAIEGPGNDLQRYVETTCVPDGPFDPCLEAVLEDPEVVRLRAEAETALENATTMLPPELRDVLRQAAQLKIASQATREPAAALVGPPTGIVLDYRMDDGGVESLLAAADGEALREAVLGVLAAARINREDSEADIAADREDLSGDDRRALDAMAATFDSYADTYQRMSAVENAEILGLGVIGGQALAIELNGSDDNAVARSVVQARAEVVRDAFDALLEDARGFDRIRREHVLGYALLSMLPTRNVDVRIDVEMDLSDRFAQDYDHYRAAGQAGFDAYGHGPGAALIGGGVFDVDELITLD